MAVQQRKGDSFSRWLDKRRRVTSDSYGAGEGGSESSPEEEEG